MTDYQCFIADGLQMQAFGAKLALCCKQLSLLELQGDLGAGKTTLTRGFLRGLGVTGAVKSPTYTLVELYECVDMNIAHFDLYRLADPEELLFIGIEDYLADRLCIVEWPEKGQGVLPVADLECVISYDNEGRHLYFKAGSQAGQQALLQLQSVTLR
ncbi:ADP-binding protein [Piscirickettsia salmonis]|uniref:tRNA (adenosine(37)-N6)-threonylcarbamoyltransferase complex ATPase subunit type 1 TsaE n=1 Tax=Piscirickettsia salmonis TaxID=1238 RepID=UPI0012B9B11A|nr:ADP-binding protein [Piscirickettsia salmonis]QGP54267.1 ADP-binding protein [Piscirickettsia salmonis]QGP59836.1 ADP-binding protein [Piscirickettsia salmonis]QGP63844.1 ADP-binding protein [Piscirickettsia salmonis]